MRQNVGSFDRIIRFSLAIGLASFLLGMDLRSTWLVEWLVVALVLLVTGTFSFCPLYFLLGISSHHPVQS